MTVKSEGWEETKRGNTYRLVGKNEGVDGVTGYKQIREKGVDGQDGRRRGDET